MNATPPSAIATAGQHLVVVVAHPDDETFGCGSLIAAASAAGARVTVICATLGEAGERRSDPETDHLPLGEVRRRELFDAADILGVHHVELLGFGDSDFDGPFPEGALCAVDPDEFTALIRRRFDEYRPDVVAILDGGDGHRDHRFVRAAVEAAIERSDVRVPIVMACLPNSLMRRWVTEMNAQASDTAYLSIDLDLLGTPDDAHTAIDASHVLDRRLRAIACHRSQGSPWDTISPELRTAFLATDHVQVIGELAHSTR